MILRREFTHEALDLPQHGSESCARGRIVVWDVKVLERGVLKLGRNTRSFPQRSSARFPITGAPLRARKAGALHDLPPGSPADRTSSFGHSITMSTSPAATAEPGCARTSTTRPVLGDFISFCIFIASTT